MAGPPGPYALHAASQPAVAGRRERQRAPASSCRRARERVRLREDRVGQRRVPAPDHEVTEQVPVNTNLSHRTPLVPPTRRQHPQQQRPRSHSQRPRPRLSYFARRGQEFVPAPMRRHAKRGSRHACLPRLLVPSAAQASIASEPGLGPSGVKLLGAGSTRSRWAPGLASTPSMSSALPLARESLPEGVASNRAPGVWAQNFGEAWHKNGVW